jgi:hypothetical protein
MASGGNFLCFIVWREMVIFCFTVWREVVIFYGLLCGEWWSFFMVYCVASGGNILCFIVWRVVVIYVL